MKIKTLKYTLIIFFLTWACQISAQSTLNEQIKRVKRAIFIFNIAEQVQYNDTNSNPYFTIGILGKDRTLIDLYGLAQKRQIKNKPVRVASFSNIENITDVDVVYVNNNQNYDVDYILNKISGNNTLLITENYAYNTSMVNIVNIDEEFQYEINEELLDANDINPSLVLRQNAISSNEKWKQLFQNNQDKLQETTVALENAKGDIKHKDEVLASKNQDISTQQETIKTINSQIVAQKNVLENQKTEINELVYLSEFQKKKYSEKLKIEKQLEDHILKQIDSLNQKQAYINSNNKTIALQHETLEQQEQDIISKTTKISTINNKLSTQQTINYLLGIIIFLFLMAAILWYRSYRITKSLNKDLQEKNNDIFNKSLEITSKNKELEEFAYITSHDLKEPLTTITGLIDLIHDDYKDKLDEDALMSMTFISESSNRMRNLIDALLNYSRLGKAIGQKPTNCNILLSDIIKDLDNAIHRNNATINFQELPNVNASQIELNVLFQNLINNAIKFKNPDVAPIINISCTTTIPERQTQVFWQFQVSDNGIGIDKKHENKIFAIFQRLHARETYEGTGIGLAFCKKIVESLGGRIWFESTVNKGSTFFFTIPK